MRSSAARTEAHRCPGATHSRNQYSEHFAARESDPDPFETSTPLAFLARFIHMRVMTVAVITFANLWWRST
jgi:hypothetical protein